MVSQLFHTCHSILLQQFVVHTIQCGTNHSAVFCHVSAGIATSIGIPIEVVILALM